MENSLNQAAHTSSRVGEERVYRDRQVGGRGIAGSSEVTLREPEAWRTEQPHILLLLQKAKVGHESLCCTLRDPSSCSRLAGSSAKHG